MVSGMKKRSGSLQTRLIILVIVALLPTIALNLLHLRFITSFQASYDEIVGNMTIANSYNLNFKEELDECIYKLVFNGVPFEKETHAGSKYEGKADRTNPYVLIEELR